MTGETFHERLLRLGKAKDYAGVIATLRTPFPTSAEPGDRAERVGERSVHADQNPSPPSDPQ